MNLMPELHAETLGIPLFLFTTPTHWAAGMAALFVSHLFFQNPEISAQGLALVWLFSMLPDMIDNPESRPGMVFSGLIKLLTLGRLEIGRYVEHRGFWHSLSALALMTGLAYLIFPKAAPYLFLGMGSHIYTDGAQKRGINLFGFGEWRGRIWRKTEIPSGRKEEFYFMAAALVVVLIGSWVYSEGGTKNLICKSLGTLECSIRLLNRCRAEGRACILVLTDAQKQPGGSTLLSGEFPEPEAIGLARIIFWKDGIPYSLGHNSEDNYFAERDSFIRFGNKNKACRFTFQLRNQPLGSLKSFIPTSLPHYRISGNVLLHQPLNVQIFHNRYNTISGKGSQLIFTHASLPDIETYSLQHLLVESADLELAYYAEANEECRWIAPKQFPSAGLLALSFSLGRGSNLLVAEGDVIPAGGLIAVNAGLDEEIRILEQELQAEVSQSERREQERQRRRELNREQERVLSAELAEKESAVRQLLKVRDMSAKQLLYALRQRPQENLSPEELSASANKILRTLLRNAEKESKEARDRFSRLREGNAKELLSYQTAKEQSALKTKKLSSKHSELKVKREVRSAISGKVVRIEKAYQDMGMRVKVLVLSDKTAAGQN